MVDSVLDGGIHVPDRCEVDMVKRLGLSAVDHDSIITVVYETQRRFWIPINRCSIRLNDFPEKVPVPINNHNLGATRC